ncbi:S41 family peptidase [Postechiella marina]|uniref:S41 family peptidase n=1 Tax=Postechiella marina TaxID=943941 RepID=A0ABP8BZ17_9FLAO
MDKYVLIICIVLTLFSCKSVERYNREVITLHSVADLQKDVDKVYSQLKKHHPKLYQYTSKSVLDYKIDSLKKSITKPINSRAFYKKIAPVLAHVRQGHISVSSASKRFTRKESKELKKNKFEFYDLDFDYINDKLWIINTRGKDSSLVGSEVVKIENDNTSDLIKIYKTRYASDGYNKTLHNRSVGRYFASLYYKDKGFVDSLTVTLKNKDSIYVKVLRRVPKKTKNQDSLKIKKKTRLAKTDKQLAKAKAKQLKRENKKRGYIAKRKEYNRNFSFIGKDSTVAYMNIRSFTRTNYKRFYKESFKKIDSAKTNYLILDLRNNGGGRIAEIDYLYAYLTTKPYKFMEDSEVNSRLPIFKYLMSNTTSVGTKVVGGLFSPFIIAHNLVKTTKRDGKIYYKFKYSKEKEPNALNFKGQIYVLINGNSFSASSLISTHLQANKRAIFVGEETGGAYNGCVAGIYKIYKLPTSQIKTRIGLMQIEAPEKQTPDGYGVRANIKIEPTILDKLSRTDPELNWVLNDIYNQK